MSSIREVLGQPQSDEHSDEMEKAISKIAEIMSYSGDLKRLMQLTRVADAERHCRAQVPYERWRLLYDFRRRDISSGKIGSDILIP